MFPADDEVAAGRIVAVASEVKRIGGSWRKSNFGTRKAKQEFCGGDTSRFAAPRTEGRGVSSLASGERR